MLATLWIFLAAMDFEFVARGSEVLGIKEGGLSGFRVS
jgi:hypothetical protein